MVITLGTGYWLHNRARPPPVSNARVSVCRGNLLIKSVLTAVCKNGGVKESLNGLICESLGLNACSNRMFEAHHRGTDTVKAQEGRESPRTRRKVLQGKRYAARAPAAGKAPHRSAACGCQWLSARQRMAGDARVKRLWLAI